MIEYTYSSPKDVIMKLTKRFIKYAALILIISLALSIFPSLAADNTEIGSLKINGAMGNMRDGSFNTYTTVTAPLTLTADEKIDSVYIIFRSSAVSFTVSSSAGSLRFEEGYLQYHADLGDIASDTLTVTFEGSVGISDIYAFGEGELPEFVHTWEKPHEKADLLLFTSHADDEQLFFAGILPYYAGQMGYRVQVTYFTDHVNEPGRRQELLNGLWTVGVRNYPVIGPFPDEYSESYDGALSNVERHGFTEDDVIAHQTEQIRRFSPLVVIGHDLKGEYGHGQHMLNAETLIKAIENATDPTFFSTSAEKYGTWDTPKLYLHLYGENTIVMDWDKPLDAFGGATAFQMTQKGFLCHNSQQFTWFREWMNGSAGDRTMASQITYLSPCRYGLYRTTVGADVQKNDFFENVTVYAEQERIAAEEEAKRLEEEKKKKEEEESRAIEESLKAELEAAVTTATERNETPDSSVLTTEAIFILAMVGAAIISTVAVLSLSASKRKKKKKRMIKNHSSLKK